MEILHTDTASPKLTIAANRITIKIPKSATPEEAEWYKEFLISASENIPYSGFTLRGCLRVMPEGMRMITMNGSYNDYHLTYTD